MPLTTIQQSVAEILRRHLSEYNYVAGGAVLNRDWSRLSDDMDIFLDDRNHLPHSAEHELETLRNAGYAVELTTDSDLVVEAILRKDSEETRVEWFDDEDTCRRFFPAQDDPEFGYRLHDADLAVNKVLCAARRNSTARDAVDLEEGGKDAGRTCRRTRSFLNVVDRLHCVFDCVRRQDYIVGVRRHQVHHEDPNPFGYRPRHP